MPTDPFRAVIVGAGFAGTATAIALLRGWAAERPLEVTLLERSGRHGPGIAYATPDPRHLLNVPAAKMSALEDRPDDLIDWARARGTAVRPEDYVPRGRYGDYVRDTLAAAERDAAPGSLRRVSGEVVRIDGAEPAVVVTAAGGRHRADAVVLAVGLSRPEPIGAELRHPAYLADPWDHRRIAELAGTREVLVIGTGLTMVDVALTLSADDAGPRVTALSRSGLLPRAHVPGLPTPGDPAVRPGECTTADELAGRVEAAARASRDWRDVIDGLRPVTQAVWQALPEAEKARFVDRHSRRWEVHRSRMAPEVAERIRELLAAGRLRVLSGTVAEIDPRDYDAIVNSAGPSWDLRGSADPLLRSLFERGQVSPGPVGFGLRTDGDGRCSSGLYTLGSLRRGELWETIAVPEIREQATRLTAVFSRLADAVPAV